MKALSVRQPWAELIVKGQKTIELRTWRTSYRGLLAIHAGKTVDEEACLAYDCALNDLVRGALVGTVQIVDVMALDESTWVALQKNHLSLRDFRESMFGWKLENPQRLPHPIPLRGRMSLFDVQDGVLTGKIAPPSAVLYSPSGDSPEYDPAKPFELHVVPRNDGEYGLALYQWPVAANVKGGASTGRKPPLSPIRPQKVAELASVRLLAVADQVLEALRNAGFRATELSAQRRKPLRLDEEIGVRLGLLFLAVRLLTRMDRIEGISHELNAMPSEEAYYWFSKCTSEGSGSRAQRALRILLASE